jgi:nitrogen fixation protein NifB
MSITTLTLMRQKFPQLSLCISTNGLGLAGRAKALHYTGVRHVTVTVNAVDPAIGEKIVSHVEHEGKTYTGKEAAEILLERQLAGIKEAATLGLEIKINTVLIPGVNDEHVGEIARVVSELGAGRHNIIPLIPKGEFAETKAPDCAALDKAREQAAKYVSVFRKCTHCRADACGVPGINDFSKELYEDQNSFRCSNNCG